MLYDCNVFLHFTVFRTPCATKGGHSCPVASNVRLWVSHALTAEASPAGIATWRSGCAWWRAALPPQWSLCKWVLNRRASDRPSSASATSCTVWAAWALYPESMIKGAWHAGNNTLLDDSQPRWSMCAPHAWSTCAKGRAAVSVLMSTLCQRLRGRSVSNKLWRHVWRVWIPLGRDICHRNTMKNIRNWWIACNILR